jgi:hypothetical protein
MQSCLRFFQLLKAEHTTPLLTDGYASGDSFRVTTETRVGNRSNVGEERIK